MELDDIPVILVRSLKRLKEAEQVHDSKLLEKLYVEEMKVTIDSGSQREVHLLQLSFDILELLSRLDWFLEIEGKKLLQEVSPNGRSAIRLVTSLAREEIHHLLKEV